MPSYTGTYVARVESDLNGILAVVIPQVFQGSRVPLDKWVGERPRPADEGFVTFLNGEAAWPVWMGPGRIGSGNGSEISTGGGVEEVWVGPDEPPVGPYEVWVDTDATSESGGGGGLGELAYVVKQDETEVSTTVIPIPELSVTVTVPAGRRIEITADLFAYRNDGLPGEMDAHIREGDWATGTQLINRSVWIEGSESGFLILKIRLNPTAGTHTYDVWARSGVSPAGSGILNMYGDWGHPGQQCRMWVDDIGAA